MKCKTCGKVAKRPVIGMCKSCYNKNYIRRREMARQEKLIKEFCSDYKWSVPRKQEEELTHHEYLSIVYDKQLKIEIEYYLKTGELYPQYEE